jgi:ATP-dependent helicase/nuclease subunit B
MALFDRTSQPRVFATPVGVDFSSALINGIDQRLAGAQPHDLGRIEIYVNTARLQRRLRAIYAERRASFLPRIKQITELANQPGLKDLPPAASKLRHQLEISQLIAALLDRQPELAPRAALFDLAESLANLMAEMQEEQVFPQALAQLDVAEHAQHWQKSQAFLSIVTQYFGPDANGMTAEARQNLSVDQLAQKWRVDPPLHPILIAGSTGSRGTTARLMALVATLPQGAVILPGFDFDQPVDVWDGLLDSLTAEDHPQFRFADFAARVGIKPDQITNWSGELPKTPARTALVSLALRPAPVTDQWRTEGPLLKNLGDGVKELTLLEAATPQAEAAAIALRLRQAAEDGSRAALISPDRTLTRQVTAALNRWGIEPDDSAGQPLALSAAGRFLRHVADVFGRPLTGEALLILLKHPLSQSASDQRGQHLLRTRDLELEVLRGGSPFPTHQALQTWAEQRTTDPGAIAWVDWVHATLLVHAAPAEQLLTEHLERHLQTATALACGVTGEGSGGLWLYEAGKKAEAVMQAFQQDADAGGVLSDRDYQALLAAVLNAEEVRDPVRPHPNIMIWGAMEARVQGADLVILAGLNEGVWPAAPGADPWLNRQMRANAGLRLPDRVIGLATHDFQQAIASGEVWLTRSRRNAETETVPSRWLNRLTNLMQGISADSQAALEQMRQRGAHWLDISKQLATPQMAVPPAPRPAPQPPLAARPKRLSVTQVERLIRDPYAIYARSVLRLRPLRPLRQSPDAPLRGTILHDVLCQFIDQTRAGLPNDAIDQLLLTAETVLHDQAPWPAARRLWFARMERIAPWLIDGEVARRQIATPYLLEARGQLDMPELDLKLTATADRIDRTEGGDLVIYDYKTGGVPSPAQERSFNKQLWLEALMAERGAFEGAEPLAVRQIAYIGLGAGGKVLLHVLAPGDIAAIASSFGELIKRFAQPDTGYPSRRAVFDLNFGGDFDHLARYGEWDATTPPTLIRVGS